MARVGGIRRPRRHVRHRRDGRRARDRGRGSRARRHGARRPHAGRRRCDLQTPLLGLGNLANVLAAIARRRCTSTCRSTAIVDARRARCGRRTRRGELLRLPGGVTLIDDSYNSSPAALKRALETVGGGDRQRAQGGGARRDARARRSRRRAARGVRRARRPRRASTCSSPSAARRRGRWPTPRSRPACRRASVVCTWRQRGGGRSAAARAVRPGDLVLVKGSRGIGTDLVVDRLKAEFA